VNINFFDLFFFSELAISFTNTTEVLSPVPGYVFISLSLHNHTFKGIHSLAHVSMQLHNHALDVILNKLAEADQEGERLVKAFAQVILHVQLHWDHSIAVFFGCSSRESVHQVLWSIFYFIVENDIWWWLNSVGVLKLNHHDASEFSFHARFKVKTINDSHRVFVGLEHPVLLVISVLNLGRTKWLSVRHGGVHSSSNRSSNEIAFKLRDNISDLFCGCYTSFIGCHFRWLKRFFFLVAHSFSNADLFRQSILLVNL